MPEIPITGSGRTGLLKIVLANGVFDLMHSGHIAHLKEARALGDCLFVGLTKDEFVNKPGRPIQDWDDRAAVLRELGCVTAVIACESGVDALLQAKPQVFVKGIDYVEQGLLPEEIKICRDLGVQIYFTKSQKKSTTEIIAKIVHEHKEKERIMWNSTRESLPPKSEILAVRHTAIGNYLPLYIDTEAIWDGTWWMDQRTKQMHERNHFEVWRRLET